MRQRDVYDDVYFFFPFKSVLECRVRVDLKSRMNLSGVGVGLFDLFADLGLIHDDRAQNHDSHCFLRLNVGKSEEEDGLTHPPL